MSIDKAPKPSDRLSGLALIVAVAAIVVWVAFVVVLLVKSNSGNSQWTRLTFVFGSVEAIAFSAAGALFGVSVQRERVQQAEVRADTNAHDATSGRALALFNQQQEGGQILEKDGESAFETYGPGGAAGADLRQRYADAARRLFPDL